MFIVPLHAVPWMPIARDMSAKFKVFSFLVIKSYSIFPYSAFSSIPFSSACLMSFEC